MKKQIVNEGDLFAIPLYFSQEEGEELKNWSDEPLQPNQAHAFGRVIRCKNAPGILVEIFKYYGKIPSDSSLIPASGRLFNPVSTLFIGLRNGRWKIIHSPKHFDKSEVDYNKIQLVMGFAPHLILWEGGKQKPISVKEAIGIELYNNWHPFDLEDRIKKTLGILIS